MFEKLFDFSDVGNFVQTLTQEANKKMVASKELAEQTLQQSQAVTEAAAQYNAQGQKSLERLQTIEAKGDDARAKAESGNIIDRITLIGDQMFDPRNYTQEGRTKQVAETTQMLGAQGQVFNVKANLIAAQQEESKARYNMAVTDASAGANLLRAQVDGLQLMNSAMQNTEMLRQGNLMQMDLPTLQQTLGQPMNPELNGKIAINGMTYTPGEMRERVKQLETREQLSMLSPMATDPDFASKMRVHQNMVLANYSLPELEKLREDKYIMPDGTQVEPQVFDEHYLRQTQMQKAAFDLAMNKMTLENQVPSMIEQSGQMSVNVQKYATPGTPLAVANAQFLSAVNSVTAISEMDKTPVGKLKVVEALGAAQTQLMKSVDQEALQRAGGDKQVADIYRSEILGQPIQPSVVEDVIRTKYTKGQGFGELLSNETSQRIRKNADVLLAKKQQAAANSFDGLGASRSRSEMKEEAINEALEMERQNAGITGVNVIQQASTQRSDNPAIKAGVVPGKVFEIQTRAASSAMDAVAAEHGLDSAAILALKNGRPQDAGISDQKAGIIAQQANIQAVMAEYDMFEKEKPGLGYEMQQWYVRVLPEMAKNYRGNMSRIEGAIVGDAVLNEAQKLGSMYTMADESVTERGKKLAAEVATGIRSPEKMWPILLNMNKNLADSQKQSLYYDVILPAIQTARSSGANDEVAGNAAFSAITNFKPEDPTLASAIKQMQRGLPDELDRFQTIWRSMMIRTFNDPMTARQKALPSKQQEKMNSELETMMPWLKRN